MKRLVLHATTLVATMAAAVPGFAGTLPPPPVPLGRSLGAELSASLGGSLPIAQGGLLAMVAAGVAAGIWLARRKR
ncbi:MAG: hypothetical protein U5L06_04140 [Rhodovibrio sp.]|nr:hypothetical protein [Rhodovibrio sp.]